MIDEIFGRFDPTLAVEVTVKVLLALLLGGVVGWDRERQRMPAGIRTFMLVSVGACIFTLLSRLGFPGSDPARVAAQIVSGIGFLGAGVMIQRKGTIYGLTSAAGIWAVAAIGMAIGSGRYFIGVLSALAIYVVLAVLRRWFKASVLQATRRTLRTALGRVRGYILAMGQMVESAIVASVRAVVVGDRDLAQQVIDQDDEINILRYRVEEECLAILRTHQPQKIQLRTVLAATHIATNLERMGDYAKEIARVRQQMGQDSLRLAADDLTAMADQACELLHQVLAAFDQDDVAAAEGITERVSVVDRRYEEIVEMITEKMTDKRTRRFERGANALNVAYHLKRTAERVTNIAERIIFVRTGALAELERQD